MKTKQRNLRDQTVLTIWMYISVCGSEINKNAVNAKNKHLTTDNATHSITNVK